MCGTLSAQDTIDWPLSQWIKDVGCDTIKRDSMCIERGHISSGIVMGTLMGDYTEYVDTDSTTIKIYHDPNSYTYACGRCGCTISEYNEPDTTIIWKRNTRQGVK